MSDPGLPLLASGRAADVYDVGDGTVLRRYRAKPAATFDVAYEARLMTWASDHGIRVPRTHRAEAADLVMDRVDGPTMLEDLERRPWRLAHHSRVLADLHRQLEATPAPPWVRPGPNTVPTGASLVHLDLHPMNVILSAEGPVVIDWTNAGAGPSGFDAALTYVLMASFDVAGLRDRVGRRGLVEAFALARGRSLVAAHLTDACRHRLTDDSLTTGEQAAVESMLDR